MNKLIKLSLFFISFFLVSGLTAEMLLRVAHVPKYESPFSFVTESGVSEKTLNYFQLDSKKIYSIKPNTYFDEYNGTDKNGFRVQPHEASPSSEAKLIIMVGDSFTYGNGVKHDEAYPAQVELHLTKLGFPALVYNAGIPGYGADQTYMNILELMEKYAPDLIIWNFNMNDIGDTDETCLLKQSGSQLQIIPGYLNTLFIQGYAYQHFPRWLTDLNVTNFMLFLPNRLLNKSRLTFACTGSLTYFQIQNKIVALIRNIHNKTTSQNSKLLITLAPFQFYFDPSLSQKEASVQEYFRFRDLLVSSEAQFIDTNELIAHTHDSKLALFRAERNAQSDLKTETILGTQSDSLAHSLFQDDNFPYGWHHLNEKGNMLFAEIVATEAAKIL